jgi:hypothetical protein
MNKVTVADSPYNYQNRIRYFGTQIVQLPENVGVVSLRRVYQTWIFGFWKKMVPHLAESAGLFAA